MALKDWSTTPANNATVGSINWVEGQAPNTVNNSSREEMADVRTFYENIEWRDWGVSVTRTGNTTFEMAGDYSSEFVVGRRLKLNDSSTLYGVITASDYNSTKASYTTVTVDVDDGTALSASLDSGGVELGINTANYPVIYPYSFHATRGGSDQSGIVTSTSTLVQFGTETFDKGGTYTAGSRQHNPNVGGVWQYNAAVAMDIDDGSYLEIRLYKDSSTLSAAKRVYNNTGGSATMFASVSKLISVTASNTMEVQVYHTNAAAGTVKGNTAYSYFEGQLVY